MLQRLVRFLVLRLVQLFYPRIEVRGIEHLPPSGPTLFVLNHPNGLLDPLLLMAGIKRHVVFLGKSTFFGNPIGRLMMNAFGALPVYRHRDEGLAGGPNGDIADRNEETFARCRALLGRGEALALFPEGTTHSQTTLLPLRTGAARIALSAEAENSCGLRIVPVGLWYQNKTQFRSSALVAIGRPIEVAAFTPAYRVDERQTVRDLTDQIADSLDAVVLQAENAELLNGIPVIAAWTSPEGAMLTLQQQHAYAARLLVAYTRLHAIHSPHLQEIAQLARRYARILRTFGISDPWALELAPAHRKRLVGLMALLVLSFPLAVAGFALSYGPYRLAAPLTPVLLGEHKELTSTGKLIIGSALIVIGWIIPAMLGGLFVGLLWGLLLFASAPLLGYIALRWGEWWREVREVIVYNWLPLRHHALVQQLIAKRRELARKVMLAVQTAEQMSQ